MVNSEAIFYSYYYKIIKDIKRRIEDGIVRDKG